MVIEEKAEQQKTQKILNGHPLDPLSIEEINRTVEIIKTQANLGKELLFETIVLREPAKTEILNYKPNNKIPREAFVVALNYKEEKVYELIVSLDDNQLLNNE